MSFLPVIGYEGAYEVNAQGTVRSIDRSFLAKDGIVYKRKGKVLRSNPNKQVEYQQVSLWLQNQGTSHYVHRLVATAHIANPLALPEVNHKDGNRQNNLATNLEWTNRNLLSVCLMLLMGNLTLHCAQEFLIKYPSYLPN